MGSTCPWAEAVQHLLGEPISLLLSLLISGDRQGVK